MIDSFFIGMFSTLSLNIAFSRSVDALLAGVISIAGGVASAVAVAWVKRCRERKDD